MPRNGRLTPWNDPLPAAQEDGSAPGPVWTGKDKPRPPQQGHLVRGRLRLKCDGTRAETRFRLSAKRTSPFKSAGMLVQSTTGSRDVRISGSNTGYIMFRGSVKGPYWLPTPFASFSFTSSPARHRVPSHFNWTLMLDTPCSEVV
jgi:hypothetical protein